jgi:hypothetical protein
MNAAARDNYIQSREKLSICPKKRAGLCGVDGSISIDGEKKRAWK